MAKKFIAEAIRRPGALRARAKRLGLIKGAETLSAADLNRLQATAKTARQKRQVVLARTLKKF